MFIYIVEIPVMWRSPNLCVPQQVDSVEILFVCLID